jgi:hypothetical protein
MSVLPHFLDNLLKDSGDVILTHLLPLTPRKIPGTHFCQRLSKPLCHFGAGSTRLIEKKWFHRESNVYNTFRLVACVAPQSKMLPTMASPLKWCKFKYFRMAVTNKNCFHEELRADWIWETLAILQFIKCFLLSVF